MISIAKLSILILYIILGIVLINRTVAMVVQCSIEDSPRAFIKLAALIGPMFPSAMVGGRRYFVFHFSCILLYIEYLKVYHRYLNPEPITIWKIIDLIVYK